MYQDRLLSLGVFTMEIKLNENINSYGVAKNSDSALKKLEKEPNS